MLGLTKDELCDNVSPTLVLLYRAPKSYVVIRKKRGFLFDRGGMKEDLSDWSIARNGLEEDDLTRPRREPTGTDIVPRDQRVPGLLHVDHEGTWNNVYEPSATDTDLESFPRLDLRWVRNRLKTKSQEGYFGRSSNKGRDKRETLDSTGTLVYRAVGDQPGQVDRSRDPPDGGR